MSDESVEIAKGYVEKYNDEAKAILEMEWKVGAMDRGMGRKTFAVIAQDGPPLIEVKHLCQKEIVEHIVKLHNIALKHRK